MRTIFTFCVEDIGEDSSLCTGPEYGEGVSDGIAEHPPTDIQKINVMMISRSGATVLLIYYTDIIWICL